MPLSDYYGAVSICYCTNADTETPMPCERCKCRGYVAQCLACLGKGQTEVPVAGGSGLMKSTCSTCGGGGTFPINKPADWDIFHPAVVEEVTAEQLAAA